ncbi:MAG TPA: BamA/TamA family outer membrane protein [Gemmatimonadaceae bacterium]|nr:BamA/TamA family outer membrane protein [Gemmatimonadaceae bacterium]
MTRLVLASLLAVLFCLPGRTALRAQESDEREAPEVKDLKWSGVESVGKDDLEESIETEETRCRSLLLTPFCLVSNWSLFKERHYLDRTELRRDMLRIRVFYWKRGWRDAQVDTVVTPKDGGVRVEFKVTEGPPTRISAIRLERPAEVLSDNEVRNAMKVRAGDPLNLIALDSSVVFLKTTLWDKGYGDAEARVDTIVVDTAAKAASIRASVDPKWPTTVGRISISGNERVSERTIRNSLTLSEGRLYKRNELVTSQRNLYESNLFRRAVIIVPPQGDSVKHIEITVQEAPLREIRASAGFNTIEFGQLEGRLTRYNWFGGGRRLDFRAAVGNLLARSLNAQFPFQEVLRRPVSDRDADQYFAPTWQATADFTQPWFQSPRNTLGLSAFTHRRSAPAIFVERGFGASATFTRTLASRAPASLTYRFELTRVEASDVYFCENFGICDPPDIEALRARQKLSPLALSFVTDRGDDPLDPSRGYFARADVEHASAFTMSDYRYNRVSGEYRRYKAFGRHAVLAWRARGGWVKALESSSEALLDDASAANPILHPRKRFYAGGAQSVRGYGENQLGPRVLTIDPGKLLNPPDTNTPALCTRDQLLAEDCPGAATPTSSNFEPRPVGGSTLLEGSIEYRFGIWRSLDMAVFVDAAVVGEGDVSTLTRGTSAVTPGFGFRYTTPVGPIRVDLGIKPRLAENLPIVTEVIDDDGSRRIVALKQRKAYDPLEDSSKEWWRQALDRLTLHLSIGQAF